MSSPNSPHQALSPGQENKLLWQSLPGHQCICYSGATGLNVSVQLPVDLPLTSEAVHYHQGELSSCFMKST